MLRFATVYQVKNGDDLGSPQYWNLRFNDIDVRLNACEGYNAVIMAASQTVINAGIERINNTLQPLLDTLTAQVTAMQTTVNTLETSITGETGSVTAQMEAMLTTAEGYVDELEALGTIDGGTF